ncbi:amidohydrolase [Parahaliea maris]|uniref:Amidohydrolase n=1 Tax=Parahaliea maris TaxID=2716870 RepID=A0A5C8ZWL7_9GAMM|nr:amidohydrolase [Parahaliea maris]TXS92953.1 amidohydrolase [Parahaliea maris]
MISPRNMLLATLLAMPVTSYAADIQSTLDHAADAVESDVIRWRRDFHQHPELGNREHRTAGIVANHLKSLGIEVTTGIAHTGVVGILKGAKPGPVVALRADMDALPVKEMTGLPFASTAVAEYGGKQVPVMHACGHDAHTAMLMGAASVLAAQRSELSGTVMFIFQPAEESPPPGEEGGAELMLEQGLFDTVKPDAVFGLHVGAGTSGTVTYRSGPAHAASDTFHITLKGRQSHGSMPWFGVDPVTLSGQVVLGLQTIASRRVNLMESPAVISVGTIRGGVRHNIIPSEVTLEGTIRSFYDHQRAAIHADVKQVVEHHAEAVGATADIDIQKGYPALINDRALIARMLPTIKQVVGETGANEGPMVFGSDDFSYFANETPGLFLWLGTTPPGEDPMKSEHNHSPYFDIDEPALSNGVKLLSHLAFVFLAERN